MLISKTVLLEGLVVDRSIAKNFPEEIQEPYLAIADKMKAFNSYAASEPRVTTTMIPIFNGVTQIMWK
jgi:caffeoyl-CoA O-methyltransferase